MHPTEISRAAAELAGSMRLKGAPNAEIHRRLTELGLRADAARTILEKTPLLLERTRGTARLPGPPRLFISHDPRDESYASKLAKRLGAGGARIIRGAATEPILESSADGIAWSHTVVLLWSEFAKRSLPCREDSSLVRTLRKDAIVVALDATPLPRALSRYPRVDGTALEDAGRAVLQWIVDDAPSTRGATFRGRWQAVMSVYALVEAEYEIELHEDGSILGGGHMTNTGCDGALTVNIVNLSTNRTPELPLTGRWSYDETTSELTLVLRTRLRGEEHADRIVMNTNGWHPGGDDWLEAVTRAGLPWRFRRNA